LVWCSQKSPVKINEVRHKEFEAAKPDLQGMTVRGLLIPSESSAVSKLGSSVLMLSAPSEQNS
jgi:hypothetical protein